MNRRDFIKFVGTTSLTIPSWGWVSAHAQSTGYSGRVLINVFAQGGLDQSSWADPRETDKSINFWVGTPAGTAGNIRFAPIGDNATFFTKYYRNMLVINGVDLETNGHDQGTVVGRTGVMDMGYPNITELFASVNGQGLPLAAMGSCGPSVGLRACAPIPNAQNFQALVVPNAQSASATYMKPGDLDKVAVARAARMHAVIAANNAIPRLQNVAAQFIAAADSRAMLQKAAGIAATQIDAKFPDAHIGLLAAQAGIASSMELATGGFDAHSNIANDYATALPNLTNLVDFIWTKAAELGIDNRIFVRIFSDLGREPFINSGNGKDHWPLNTMILMEKNPAWGNRVFGASGPKHETLKINTATGVVDPDKGAMIKSAHIHDALRNYLNIQTQDPRFNLKVPPNEQFAFFSTTANTGYPNR
jgi:uncharacterized protein (DUF1501 family)